MCTKREHFLMLHGLFNVSLPVSNCTVQFIYLSYLYFFPSHSMSSSRV